MSYWLRLLLQVKALQEAGDKGLSSQTGVVLQGLSYLPGNSEKNFQASALRGGQASAQIICVQLTCTAI